MKPLSPDAAALLHRLRDEQATGLVPGPADADAADELRAAGLLEWRLMLTERGERAVSGQVVRRKTR